MVPPAATRKAAGKKQPAAAADGSALSLAHIGQPMGLLAIMGTDEDPRRPDPNPVPLILEPTRRDLVSTASERQILAIGLARW